MVRRSYFGNWMFLYKSIMVSKIIVKVEYKCLSEWLLIVYLFILYILLFVSFLILEIVWVVVFIMNYILEESGFFNLKVFFLSNKFVVKS